jgi:hypothetical protein
MNRFQLWFVACLLWIVGVTALYVRCPGCLDRSRQNRLCDWTGDTASRLDLQRSADWQHLVLDAQLAEELATRFADAARLKLGGVEGHGGLIEGGAVVRACEARMFAAIEANHGVAQSQIQVARAHRNVGYDTGVLLLFVPVYWFGATLVQHGLKRRFWTDRLIVRWVATVVASVAVGLVGTQLAGLWSTMWELNRIGNDHIGGHRLATFLQPTEQHFAALFIIAILLFWLVDYVSSDVVPDHLAIPSELMRRQSILFH